MKKKEKRNAFCNSKKHNFFTGFFGWSFGFAIQRRFVELEKALR
jgi:hypothetical protein